MLVLRLVDLDIGDGGLHVDEHDVGVAVDLDIGDCGHLDEHVGVAVDLDIGNGPKIPKFF